jgi:uncharacterized cupredoxin-like copper-binding protein
MIRGKHALASLIAVPAIALIAAGCGGGTVHATASPSPSPVAAVSTASGETLRLVANANGKMAFNTNSLTAPRPGAITLSMRNPSSSGLPHGIAIKGNGVNKSGAVVAPGGTSTVTVRLKRGTYTFYCPVPGHAQAGMKGTLTVR